jgi:hypothetical protein
MLTPRSASAKMEKYRRRPQLICKNCVIIMELSNFLIQVIDNLATIGIGMTNYKP